MFIYQSFIEKYRPIVYMVRMGGVGGPRATKNYHPEVVGSIPHVRIFFLFSLSLLFLRVRPNGTVVPRTWAFPCCRCFLFFSACHRRGKYRTPKQAIFGAKKGAQSAIGHFFSTFLVREKGGVALATLFWLLPSPVRKDRAEIGRVEEELHSKFFLSLPLYFAQKHAK